MSIDEGRAVGGHEDNIVAAEHDGTLGIAGVLGEFLRRRGHHMAHQPLGEPDKLAGDVGAGLAPEFQRSWIALELDADLLKDAVGGVLDAGEAFLGRDLIGRNLPLDIGRCHRSGLRPPLHAGRPAPALPSGPRRTRCGFHHWQSTP